MEILFASIARAGGVEIPEGKRIFAQRPTPAPATTPNRAPGHLKIALGRLLRGLGGVAVATGERLLARPQGRDLGTSACR